MEDYKQDIIATRVGGLGSSDAKMVWKLSNGGKLCQTDKDRLGVMTGQLEPIDFKSEKMALGDEREMDMFKSILSRFPQAVSNPYRKEEALSQEVGFSVFTHIDIEVETGDTLTWFECKASEFDTADVLAKYAAQLQWHWMILQQEAERRGKRPILYLAHYPTQVPVYDEKNERIVKIENEHYDFRTGLLVIKDALVDFKYEKPELMPTAILPEDRQNALDLLHDKLVEINKLKEKYDEEMASLLVNFKKTMLPRGIVGFDAGEYEIRYTFRNGYDSKKVKAADITALERDIEAFRNDCPELAQKYLTGKYISTTHTEETEYMQIKLKSDKKTKNTNL